MIDVLYPVINLIYSLIIVIVLISNERLVRFDKKKELFRMLLVTVFVFCMVSGLWGLLVCGLIRLDSTKIYLSTISVFFFLGVTSYIWIIFSIYYNNILKLVKRPKNLIAFVSFPFAAYIVFIFGFVGDAVYTYIPPNRFVKGDVFCLLLIYFCLVVNYLISFYMSLYAKNRNMQSKQAFSDMLLFHFIPVVIMIPQFFYYNKSFFSTGFFIAAMFMYFFNALQVSRDSLLLDNQRKNERILERSAEILFGDLDADSIIDKLLETLADYYSADYACILDAKDDENCFYLNHEWKRTGLVSLFKKGKHIYYESLGTVLEKINENGQIVINDVEPFENDTVFYNLLKSRKVHSCVASVLKKHGETVGLLIAVNLHKNTDDVSIIRSVSTFIYSEAERLRANENDDYRNKAIIDTLSSDYSSIYYVNLENDEFKPYRYVEYIKKKYGDLYGSKDIKYSVGIKAYISDFVAEDDQEELRNTLSVENLLKVLKDKKTFSKHYINVVEGKESYYEVKVARADRDDGKFDAIIGFADKDTEIREEHEMRLRNFGIISALSEEYDVIFYVDPETGDYELYSDKNLTPNENGYSIINGKDFFFENNVKGREVIFIEDRERAGRFFNRETLKKAFEETDELSFDVRLMLTGEPLWYREKIVRIEDPFGKIKYIMGIRNIEAEKQAEIEKERNLELISSQRDELERQRKDLEKALHDSEMAGKSKSDFLFNMSHDIRTPMNAIIGFTDLAIKHYDDKSRVIDYLSKVKVSSNHLLKLINEVLDMSRIENGHVLIDESPDEIYNFGTHINAILGSVFEDNNLKFEVNYREIKHNRIWADRLHVDQIFINILSNSIKYTKSGGRVSLDISEIEAHKEGYARYKVEIEDNGVGMKPEYLEHIFESFSREESATKSGIQGTGLGMAITKSLIDILGGTIDIKSERNVGTKVTIELEFRINDDTETEENISVSEINTSVLAGKKVLIVDDNELNREITREILEEYGMSVEEAEDGDVAVSKVQLSPVRYYDFVLMDIQMPHLDGYKATRLIRASQDGRFAKLPIFAMTANAFDEDKQKALAAGMNAHISKPVDVDTLIKTLCKYANK